MSHRTSIVVDFFLLTRIVWNSLPESMLHSSNGLLNFKTSYGVFCMWLMVPWQLRSGTHCVCFVSILYFFYFPVKWVQSLRANINLELGCRACRLVSCDISVIFTDRVKTGGNAIASVRPSVCPSVCFHRCNFSTK